MPSKLGLLGFINEQSEMVSNYMSKKKKDKTEHPEVKAHREHAERTNS